MLRLKLEPIKKAHTRFLKMHDSLVADILNNDFQTAEARANIEANTIPVKRTRHLKNSTNARVVRTKNGVLINISNSAKYAFAQELGSGEHKPGGSKYPITPKKPGGLLRFFWRRKGKWVSLRIVMHPGVPATHFLETATETSFRTTGLLLRTAMQRASKLF